MRALLLVAHGSRREASNATVRALAERVGSRAAGRFDVVRAAFLELAEPSIPDGIDACVERGATEVVVLPYFLAAGRHVSEDIPALVAERRRAHPGVEIRLLPHLGAHDGIVGLVLDAASGAD